MGCKCKLSTGIRMSDTDLWLKMRSNYTGNPQAHYFALVPKHPQLRHNISITVQNIVRAHWRYGPLQPNIFINFINYYIAHGITAFYLYDMFGDLSIRWDLSAWDILSYRDQKVDIFIYNLLSRLDEYPLFKNGQYSELTADDFPRKDVYNFIVFQYGVQLHSFYERLNVAQWNMMIDLDEYVYIPKQDHASHHINDYLIPYLELKPITLLKYRDIALIIVLRCQCKLFFEFSPCQGQTKGYVA
eukprot:53214_1